MKINYRIKLGVTANLLFGYQPCWTPLDQGSVPLFRPAQTALDEIEVDVASAEAEWNYPIVTLHETAEDLLTTLFPYRAVSSGDDLAAPKLPSGPLLAGMRDRDESLSALSTTLGVDLRNSDNRYSLVRLHRYVGEATHPCYAGGVLVHAHPVRPDPTYGVRGAFRQEMTKLRHSRSGLPDDARCTVKEANQYLDFFRTWGTHFIAKVRVGDVIFQVFSHPSNRFNVVKSAFEQWEAKKSGPGAAAFARFTTPTNETGFGFVNRHGNILSLSGDPALSESVAADEWREPVFAETNSVLAPFQSDPSLNLEALDKRFKSIAPIDVELAPLGLFAERTRRQIWRRVFKGAIAQAFGNGCEPNFAENSDSPATGFSGNISAGLLTTIATPTINTYAEQLDLGSVTIAEPEVVKQFTLYTNLLTMRSDTEAILPGNDVALTAPVIDLGASARAKRLVLSDEAFGGFLLSCGEFFGAMTVTARSGRDWWTVVDGLRYSFAGEDAGAKRSGVIVDLDLRTPPSETYLPRLKTSLEFAFTFADTLASGGEDGQQQESSRFALACLNWLVAIIPADTKDRDLMSLRVQALDLANAVVNPEQGAFVPILGERDYDKYLSKILGYADEVTKAISQTQAQIELRKQEERATEVAKALNENIVKTGRLLTDAIAASAKQQEDMAGYYGALMDNYRAEQNRLTQDLGRLQAMLTEQERLMDTEIANYKQVVTDWESTAWLRFGIETAAALFKVGPVIKKPKESERPAGIAFAQATELIKSAVNISVTAPRLYTSAEGADQAFRDAQSALTDAKPGFIGNLAWDELSLQFDEIVETGDTAPKVRSAKASMVRAFGTLVLQGKAVLNTQMALHRISREVYANQRLQIINQRNTKRLADLSRSFEPKAICDLDPTAIDLIGLTGYLESLQRQVFALMAKAFVLRDQSLRYDYLQPATGIRSFNMLGLKEAMVLQDSATIAARSKMAQLGATTTTPIEYRIQGVRIEDLTDGAAFRFDIQLDKREFQRYVNIRVVSVTAAVDGVAATDSGQYLLRLTYDGNPFRDRDPSRKTIVFRTPSRERVYEFDVAGNRPRFSDEGRSWSADVARITPFSAWSLAFPKTETNRGLRFSGKSVDIRLTFVLEARIVDQPVAASMLRLARMNAGADMAPSPMALKAAAPVVLLTGEAPANATGWDKEYLLNELKKQGSALNGWDVVFNMTLSQINKVLAQQYDAMKDKEDYWNKIRVETKPTGRRTKQFSKIDLTYGYPRLEFLENNDTRVSLKMDIVSGTIIYCEIDPNGTLWCDEPQDLKGEEITAEIDMGLTTGRLDHASGSKKYSVVLDMAKGAFEAKSMELSRETEFSAEIVEYFVKNPVQYVINSLDLTKIATLEALRPNEFIFKTIKTASNDLLQLYIQTAGRKILGRSQAQLNNIAEPVPIGSECSLFIASRVLFRDVLPESLGRNGWTLTGKNADDNQRTPWYGEFTSGDVSGRVDLGGLGSSVPITNTKGQAIGSTTMSYYVPNNTVDWSITGMTLGPASSQGLVLRFDDNRDVRYKSRTCTTYYSVFSKGSCSESDLSERVGVTISAVLPITVAGQGREQSLGIQVDNRAVAISGRISGGGPCGSDDFEAKFNQRLQASLPEQIKEQVNVDFKDISVFALKNLLFPENNYIKFQDVAVPGDLVIFGEFEVEG